MEAKKVRSKCCCFSDWAGGKFCFQVIAVGGQHKPVVIFDTSGINRLANDRESEVLTVALRTAFFVRLTFTNIEEVIATTEPTLRRKLMAYVRSLLTTGECIDRYNSVIERLILNFEGDPKSFDWQLVPIRSRAAEEEIARHEIITDDLADEQRQDARNAAQRFQNIYSTARPQFDSFFQKEPRERPTLSELIEHRKRSGAFWRLCTGRYNRVAHQAGDEETIRQLYAACPPFRASVLASYVAEYERCIRDEKAGVSYRSGLQDLYSAVYLPYCNDFITDDRRQARCLAAIATEGNLDVNVRSYEDFRSGLMGCGRACL